MLQLCYDNMENLDRILVSMKTNLFFLLLFFSLGLSAQVPQGFNYQAVVRNDAGELIKNQEVKVKIGILQGESSGTLVWEEEHTVTTNNLGLLSLMVGDPNALRTGGSLSDFEEIDWSAGDYYLQVAIDPGDGSGYVQMGESRLLSVPFAFYAEKSGRADWSRTADTLTFPGNIGIGVEKVNGTKLAVQGDDLDSEKPLFEVKRKDGQTVFAVYNDSIRMYVNGATTKGLRGGFAIGGFGMNKGETQTLMWISPDSARIYFDGDQKKGPRRGGFAIGGFGMTKGEVQPLMWVSPDSARFYLDQSQNKGLRSGFAIGGFGQTKSAVENFFYLQPDNYFIGHKSGQANTSGLYNAFLGYNAGMSNTTGSCNLFFGNMSGAKNFSGNHNVFIGDSAGYSNLYGYENIYIGQAAGFYTFAGYDNVYIGFHTGYSGHGQYNVYIGHEAGYSSSGASLNTVIGKSAGRALKDADYNVILGCEAGKLHETGNNNVFLGNLAGSKNVKGMGNVYIGYMAGYYATDSNKLYIDNSGTTKPLIWGDFKNNRVEINGNPYNTTESSLNFFVRGSAGGLYSWVASSDKRLKRNIHTIPDALDKVQKLRGINFEWKEDSPVEPGVRMGFIAQEAEKVIPEVVSKSGEYYTMQYAPITALLVEAIKEQQRIIDRQEKKLEELEMLKKELELLKNEMERLKESIR